MPAKRNDQFESDFQLAVVIGMLLGDGSLSKPPNGINYHLACYHSEKQLDWLRIKHKWLGDLARPIQHCSYLDKRDGKTRAGGRFHTVSAPIFTSLRNLFYPNGIKFISKQAALMMVEPVTLAVLIADDGHWDKAGIQIATKQFTKTENEILKTRMMDIWDIRAKVLFEGSYYHIRIPAEEVPKVRRLCIPFVPESLIYKFGGPDYKPIPVIGKASFVCRECGKRFHAWPSSLAKFCSRACANKFKTGKPNPRLISPLSESS